MGSSAVAEGPVLEAIGFSDIPGWTDDDQRAAFAAFLVGARKIAGAPPKTRALGIDGVRLSAVARAAIDAPFPPTLSDARSFFERWFVPMRIAVRTMIGTTVIEASKFTVTKTTASDVTGTPASRN